MAPYGYQWFSSQDRSPEAVLGGVRAAAPILDAFIDEALEERGLDSSELALVGFSQGTMMSLFVGLRRAEPVAGIVGFSGRLLAPELLAERAALAPAHPLGSRHRRPARSLQLARRGGNHAQGGRRAGRDGNLASASATRSTTKGCGAAASFSRTCSAGRCLDHAIAGEEGFEDAEDLG